MNIRAEIKTRAKFIFTRQYGVSIGAYILFGLILVGASGVSAGIGALFIMPPMLVGYSWFCLQLWRGQKGDIGGMFNKGFSDYGRHLGGILWMELFVFLWSLLFIIPGIIKSLAYSMTPFILADCPNVRATDALKLSMRMTKGRKGQVFVMYLSFIGWALLSALTWGILDILYVGPYMNTSIAGLYEVLRQDALTSGAIRPDELA